MVGNHVTDPLGYQLNPCFLLHLHHHSLSNNSALTLKRVGNSGLGNRGVDNPDCTGIYGEEYDIET